MLSAYIVPRARHHGLDVGRETRDSPGKALENDCRGRERRSAFVRMVRATRNRSTAAVLPTVREKCAAAIDYDIIIIIIVSMNETERRTRACTGRRRRDDRARARVFASLAVITIDDDNGYLLLLLLSS